MKVKLAALSLAAAVFGLSSPVAAQLAVAIIEDVQGKPAGVEFMDYVSTGKVIKLGAKDTVVIGYMKSCWRETITGGTVTVGIEQSDVQAGKVDRSKVACDASYKQLTEQQQGAVGATVFRSLKPGEKPPAAVAAPAPIHGITLFGTSPVFEMKSDGKLEVERIDVPGERHVIFVGRNSLVRGSFYDLAKVRRVLTPGGIYVARLGDRQTYFKVDAQAKAQTAIVGRLVRFE